MTKRTPIFLSILLITIGFYSILMAGTGFPKYAGEFMGIDVSARAQALGGAFTSLTNDVYATFYNPAALVQIRSTQFGFTHTQQFISSVNYDYLGFARPFSENKVLGISLIRLGVDDITDSRNAGNFDSEGNFIDIIESKLDKFNSADYVLFLSLGQQFRSKLAIGFNVKLVRRNLADHSANGVGLDASFLYTFNQRLKFSGMLRNITTTLISWDTGEKELVSPTARFGSSYLIPLPGLNSYFIPNFDLVVQTQSSPNLVDNTRLGSDAIAGAFGGEFVIQERLFLRGGYDDLQRASFGVGLKIPHINIDYSFTNFDQELGNAHRIGVLIDFQ